MDKAYDFLLHHLDIKCGDSVVVACSGGPDSMALLSLFVRIKREIDIEVICAHVNHNVREESDSEQIFVSDYCLNNGILFEYMIIENYSDDNFESEARHKRYDYFERIVKKYGAKYLFTAHHGDDLMETILMRIVRGSTIRGYGGFKDIVDMGTYKIVRPLIHMTKDEILDYNNNNDIKYVVDKTNFLDVHTRNRFRRSVLPFFKSEYCNVHSKFYKFSKTLFLYSDYIDSVVDDCFNKVCIDGILIVDEFLKLDNIIAINIIYRMLSSVYQCDLYLITDRHVELVYDLIVSSLANASICLPHSILALKSYNNFKFTNFSSHVFDYCIQFDNDVCLANGKHILKVEDTDLTDNNVIRLSSDDVLLPLYVRSRKNGDRINLKGMNGSKKIKDIFIDLKIPVDERNSWPIVIDSNNVIVWIPGLKKSKFDRQKSEKCDIILKYY